jgi:hypothetical protein
MRRRSCIIASTVSFAFAFLHNSTFCGFITEHRRDFLRVVEGLSRARGGAPKGRALRTQRNSVFSVLKWLKVAWDSAPLTTMAPNDTAHVATAPCNTQNMATTTTRSDVRQRSVLNVDALQTTITKSAKWRTNLAPVECSTALTPKVSSRPYSSRTPTGTSASARSAPDSP